MSPALAESNPYLDAMQAISDGRYDDARRSLAMLAAREPEHAGAWLDLAILQCGLGHRQEAEELFSAIEVRFFPPLAIAEIIAQQRASGCKPRPSSTRLQLRTGRGYDSNVNQGASNPYLTMGTGTGMVTLMLAPEYTPKGDNFTSLQAEASLPLGNNGTQGFGQILTRSYDSLNRYDLSSANLGIEHPWQLGEWSLRATGSLGLIGLGGRLYQHSLLAQAQVIPPLSLPTPWQASLIVATSLQYYPVQNQYNAQQNEVRFQVNHRGPDHLLQGSVGILEDLSKKNRPGGDRQGWTAMLLARSRLFGKLSGEATWTIVDGRSAEHFSPGLIDVHREQQTRQARLNLQYALGDGHSIVAEYRQVDNRENIGIFGYRERQFSLNWQWQH